MWHFCGYHGLDILTIKVANTISQILNLGIINLILNLGSGMKYNNYKIVLIRDTKEQIREKK